MPWFIFLMSILWNSCQSENTFRSVSVLLARNHQDASPSAKFDVACSNVYGSGVSNDWTMSNVSVSSSVSVIQGKACTLTLNNYFDGANTFVPVGTALVVNIAVDGTVSNSWTRQYTNQATPSPNLQWFHAAQNGAAYTMAVGYASDAVSSSSSVSVSSFSSSTVSLNNGNVAAPTVSNVTMTSLNVIVLTNYTLSAVVSGNTGCKYIDNSGSPAPYSPTSWSSVNTAYNDASATTCPILTPGLSLITGNWNQYWVAGVKKLLIWVNTVNGVSSYTTCMVGP